jgi:hypothetical protein
MIGGAAGGAAGGAGGGIGGMLGPMIGGMAGSMFQPGSKAKDQATQNLENRLSGWDQWLTAALDPSIGYSVAKQISANASSTISSVASTLNPY